MRKFDEANQLITKLEQVHSEVDDDVLELRALQLDRASFRCQHSSDENRDYEISLAIHEKLSSILCKYEQTQAKRIPYRL